MKKIKKIIRKLIVEKGKNTLMLLTMQDVPVVGEDPVVVLAVY